MWAILEAASQRNAACASIKRCEYTARTYGPERLRASAPDVGLGARRVVHRQLFQN